jgi:SH3-like domain-containing protein
MRASWSGGSALAACALALLFALGAGATVAPAAQAAKRAPRFTRSLCTDRVTVRDAPYGYAIGYLYRPQRLAVLGRPVDRWVLIRAHEGLMGWIPNGALCPGQARRR